MYELSIVVTERADWHRTFILMCNSDVEPIVYIRDIER